MSNIESQEKWNADSLFGHIWTSGSRVFKLQLNAKTFHVTAFQYCWIQV
jgi:hypothetical protein